MNRPTLDNPTGGVRPEIRTIYTMLTGRGDTYRSAAATVLSDGVRSLGIPLTPHQVESFAQLAEMLVEANSQFNLTRIIQPEDVMRRHFLDSLTTLPHIRASGDSSMLVADVGTGGGLPGLALAIVRPAWRFVLIESITKKARFVEQAAATLGLTNVEVLAERAEVLAQGRLRDTFDIVVARAVAPTGVLLEYCCPLVRSGGTVLLHKSGQQAEESAEARRVARELGAGAVAVHPVATELGLGGDRFILEVAKTGPTPGGFPRRVGLARSLPL